MTKEYRKLTDWNPKKGDVFNSHKSDSPLTMTDDTQAKFEVNSESWPISFFSDSYSLVSRATPEKEEAPTGKWIGWNGGESPVHPKTTVEVVGGFDGVWETTAHEARVEWSNVVAYRVIKEYVEPPKPREFWICLDTSTIFYYKVSGCTYVREVVGEEE